jgi:hypothetical protein
VQLGHQLTLLDEGELVIRKVVVEPVQYMFPGSLFWRYSGKVCLERTS